MNDDSNRKALTKLVERSATDAALRERLLNDPHATLAEEIGNKPDRPIRFVEPARATRPDVSGKGSRAIVLPEVESRALSEDELEAVSGGTAGDLVEDLFGASE